MSDEHASTGKTSESPADDAAPAEQAARQSDDPAQDPPARASGGKSETKSSAAGKRAARKPAPRKKRPATRAAGKDRASAPTSPAGPASEAGARETERSLLESAARLTGGLASSALREVFKRGEASLRWGSSLLLDSPLLNTLSPDRLEAMKQAGMMLHDLRETAGLTLEDLSKTLNLADTSLLAAVENGTATLSFDLVLRLAALLARYDPLPFIIRFARTYNPQIEKLLEGWGAAGLTRQIERERRFVNILRKKDDARNLSEPQFDQLLKFTEAAFDLAMDFMEQQGAAPAQGDNGGVTQRRTNTRRRGSR